MEHAVGVEEIPALDFWDEVVPFPPPSPCRGILARKALEATLATL